MQEAHAMPLTSASLSLLQKRHRKRGFDHVASYVAEQAAYPPGQSGDENVETDNPASPRKSSIILLGEEAAGPSRSAAQGHIQPKETWSKCDRKSDESPGPALTLTAKTVSRKRQRYDSSLISPIKENNAEDGIRYGSETTYVSWSTSSGRKPADTSRVTAAREVFERGKRHKMHESRQKPASTSKKKENQSGKKKKVPDLTFCEMDFLRNGPSESRPAQQAREGKKGDGKRRTECDTNEEISSFFKRAASPPRNENTDPLPSRAKHHAAPPEVREKSKQSNSQLENHPTASHYKILSRDDQKNNARDLRERTLFCFPSYLQNSPNRSKVSTYTPTHLVPHSEQPTFGSLSVNSSGNTHRIHQQATSSDTGNPVVKWLKRTSREYQPELDSDIRDKRSFLGSSVREFNGLSGGPKPPSPKISANSPISQARVEKDAGVGERLSIHPDESVITGGANISLPRSQVERYILRWQSDVVREPHRSFRPHDEIFGRPVYSLQEETNIQPWHSPDPQHLADGLNDRFTFEQPIRDDKITTDDHPMLYQAGFPASGSEHAYPPKGNLWSNLMGAAQISLGSDQDRSREAETTSLYFNNGGSVAEECEYQATRGKRRGGPDIDSYDGYTNFDNNLEENGMYEGGDLDGLGCPIVGENANADLQSEQDQAPHVRNSTSEMPQLGPKNFWRPHRLY
ncbi:hypothetical protein TWF679_003924 [Orbilia oligospora]|uniref:Uncharacterized protein n=1 Tax=Orbilia oligospora TaxID=2813651 RepID=A0A8H8VEF1_ORBOL|nr:hypothetical protein TWF679_003924 [Orbilia oligospora]